MADVKITALTAISANPVNPATFPMPMVDLLDTSMAASGSTRKVTVNQILGSGGTATLASATITGAATVGTTLGVTGVSTLTGNVGVGNAPSAWSTTFGLKATQVYNSALASNGTSGYLTNNAYYATGAYTPTYINAASTPAQGIVFNSTGANDIQFLIGAAGTAGNTIAGFAAAAMTLNSTGNLAFPTGKGIDFSAVTGGTGTATANVLNDYEEGTFTPVATGLTNVGAVTYTATYTKIGRVVYINLKVSAVTSTTSVANTTYFSGLPFNPAQNSTVTAVNEGNITSLGVGLIATGSNLFAPSWTAVQNATLSGFYYV
jgi:hypothetical protein